MSVPPLILETVFGPVQLVRGSAPSAQNMVPLAIGADGIRRALEAALAYGDSMSVMALALEAGILDSAFGVDDAEVVRALMVSLEGGHVVAVAPGGNAGGQDQEGAAAWSAYDAFVARVGKEFMVALRKHRVVPSGQVPEIRQAEDYDVVAVKEAAAILVRQALDFRQVGSDDGGQTANGQVGRLRVHEDRHSPGARQRQ